MSTSEAARVALERALGRSSEANRRLLHLALRADAAGAPVLARALRDAALAETGRAFEHLERLAADPGVGPLRGELGALLERLAAAAGEERAAADALLALGEAETAAWLRRAARARDAQLARLRAALGEEPA